ncbi:hypothetical protein T484DRAFT_2823486 [Baffinella frigidus]|nr:hypothetical protein T484DRAFT_2823486 [Cryptophyta sp. CCMP2293]
MHLKSKRNQNTRRVSPHSCNDSSHNLLRRPFSHPKTPATTQHPSSHILVSESPATTRPTSHISRLTSHISHLTSHISDPRDDPSQTPPRLVPQPPAPTLITSHRPLQRDSHTPRLTSPSHRPLHDSSHNLLQRHRLTSH